MFKATKLISFFIGLICVTLLATSTSAASIPAHFVLTGSGFGHGVGMSQIGAEGQAMEGKSASDILTYWYAGTQVLPVNDNMPIRVNVAHLATYANFSIIKPALGASFSLTNLENTTSGTTPAAITTSASCTMKFSVVGKSIAESTSCPGVTMSVAQNPSTLWNITWNSPATSVLPQIMSMNSSTANMQLKYGYVQLRYVSGKIEVSDTMNLHNEYLYGISEMPSSYLPAALQAQVIASRTYALTKMSSIRKACDCNIYSSIYDQSYIGYAKESEPGVGALWRAAVDATSVDANTGYAVLYQGSPISVYFFSSDGGETQQSEDVWGTALPYLTSVPDPWSLDIFLNPYYSHWQRVLTEQSVATAFNLPDVVSLTIGTRTQTNSAVNVIATSSTGQSATLLVGDFKTKLKIPSSWFEIAPPSY